MRQADSGGRQANPVVPLNPTRRRQGRREGTPVFVAEEGARSASEQVQAGKQSRRSNGANAHRRWA